MLGDKENVGIHSPVKKQKMGMTSRPEARYPPAQVLSPRSANSRTLPYSPIRPSPSKSLLARPVSPMKPGIPSLAGGAAGMLTNMVDKAKSRGNMARKATQTGVAAAKSKRNALAQVPTRPTRGRARSVSSASETSTGTTIVRKPVPPPAAKAPVKRGVMGTLKSIGSQKKASTASTATTTRSGRILRQRD